MTAPLLSIVMPVFNVAPYLEAAILSALNCEFRDFELIIVNDASTDDSLRIAQFFDTIDDRVRIVDLRYNTLGGAGVPSNIGVEHARGAFIGFIDSDDFITADSLVQMIKAIQDHDADVCIGNFRTFRDDTKEVSAPYDGAIWAKLPKNKPLDPRKTLSLFRTSPVPWRKIYRRSFLEKHAVRFPEVDCFFEDNPLHWDVLTAARSVVIIDVFLSYHRMARPGQTMSSNSPQLSAFFQHMTSIAQVLRKNRADFAWGEFLYYIWETRWIVARQKDARLILQFQKRFFQFMHDHVLPYIGAEHAASAKRILDRYEPYYKPCDISFLIFAVSRDADLDATMASVRALRTCETEVVLLCQDPAVQVAPEWGDVVVIGARNNASKSYNLAMPLCTGQQIVYMQAGDLVHADAVLALLKDPAKMDADVVRSEADLGGPDWAAMAGVYRRRFVQDHALYHGPSDTGTFSFNITTSVLKPKQAVSQKLLLTRKNTPQKPTAINQVIWESANAIQRVRYLNLDTEMQRAILDKISIYLTDAEMNATLDTMKQLELSRGYLTGQIFHAFHEDGEVA